MQRAVQVPAALIVALNGVVVVFVVSSDRLRRLVSERFAHRSADPQSEPSGEGATP